MAVGAVGVDTAQAAQALSQTQTATQTSTRALQEAIEQPAQVLGLLQESGIGNNVDLTV